jgi:hypothetical protein
MPQGERKSIAFNLRRLFCDIQGGHKPASTKALTQSFGLESADSFIQEFCIVFVSKLEEKPQGGSL